MSTQKCSRLLVRFVPILLFILLINLLGLGCDGKGNSYSGTAVDVLVVMMKFNQQPNCPTMDDCSPWTADDLAKIKTPRHSAQDYQAILDQGINSYYQKATYGQVYFNFIVLVNPNSPDGWWDAPHALWEYVKQMANTKGDGVLLASRALGSDIDNYQNLLLINNVEGRAGQTCCLHVPNPNYSFPVQYPVDNNQFVDMIVADVAMDVTDANLFTIVSHELAHVLGAADEYYDGAIGMGPWDLMDQDWDFNHFSAWTKLDRNWLTWADNTTLMECTTWTCEITTELDPLGIRGNNALLVPYTADPDNFVGLMAECRMRLNGEENIPEEGVLVTRTNPYLSPYQGTLVQAMSPNDFNVYSLLKPGDVYFDDMFHITIANLSQAGDSTCTVKAEINPPNAPDPSIVQGISQTSGTNISYRSPDIWIDSEVNGYNVFPDGQQVDWVRSENGWDYPIPQGVGDVIWPGLTHAVGFRIRNTGMLAADNIKVNVYVRQPLTYQLKNENCGATLDPNYPYMQLGSVTLPKYLGTATVHHLEPGESYVGKVYWIPDSTQPAEIEVSIEELPGEISVFNNTAYETYRTFHHEPLSANNQPLAVGDVSLALSSDCLSGLPYMVLPMPEPGQRACKWNFEATPQHGTIQPGETINIQLFAVPSADGEVGDACSSAIGVLAPVEDVFLSIGGFSFDAYVANPSAITCNAPTEAVQAGSVAPVNGVLSPAVSDTIALQYFDPNGVEVIRNLETSNSGDYLDDFAPTLPGLWTVQAYWLGNASYAPSTSTLCRFMVDALEYLPNQTTSCRTGPGTIYGIAGYAAKGEPIQVVGRTADNAWYSVLLAGGIRCWVSSKSGALSGDPSGLPMEAIPPTPTFTPVIPTPTHTPVPYCSQFTTKMDCAEIHGDVCRWINPSGPCVKK